MLYNRSLIAVVILILLMISSVANAQEKISKTKQHPYLYFTNSKIAATKLQIQKDTALNKAWLEMLRKADSSLLTSRGDMESLSFVYRMTGDKKYAQQAKKLLQSLLSREAWDGLDDRTPRWNSALGTARYNAQTAITYDAIYDALTNDERKQFAERIVKLGIEPSLDDWLNPSTRLHTLNSMGHNWWSAIVHQAGVASLAVMTEIPNAKQWAEDVLQSTNEWFAFNGSVLENKIATFDPAGGFYESVSYANFGVSEYLLFRLAWTNAVAPLKTPNDELLQKTMDWFIHASYPNNGQMQSLNFGDSGPYANGDRPVKLMIALGFDKPQYRWYLDKTRRGRVNEDLGTHTAMGLLLYPGKINDDKLPSLPTSAIYPTMGWATLRSSWKDNATMLGVKSGYTWNHAHADAGSFILYHKGKNVLIDGGNVNYGAPEYSSYFVRSDAHNVILFNGKAQEAQDQYNAVKTSGQLYNLLDADDFKYMLADATGPTSHYFLRNYRNIIWIGNVILIVDDLKSYEAGKFEFLLHTSKEAKKKGIDLEITDDSAAVLVRPLFPETLPNGYPHDFPEKMRLEEKIGIKDHDAKTKLPYYSFSPAENSRQTKFITAIILLDDKNKPIGGPSLSNMASAKELRTGLPKIEKLDGNNMIGVRITENGITTDLYMNLLADGRLMHRNSHNTINGWETDAYLLGMSYKEGADPSNRSNIQRYFVANGSYIRQNAKPVLSSLSKVFMTTSMNGSNADVLLQGQPLINASLWLPTKPVSLQLNNVPVTTEFGIDKEIILRTGSGR